MGKAIRYAAVGLAILVLAPLFLGTFVLLPLLIATGTVKTYAIPSSAMEPTLHCARPAPGCEADSRDRIMVRTRFVSYERADIVVFDTPPQAEVRCGVGGTFVKRIIGLPGEAVEMSQRDGLSYVVVDGVELDEPYIEDERRDSGPAESFDVPVDHYFVLGDNRSQSCDSRVWGFVPEGNLIGEVFVTYWPPGRITFR